MTVQMSRRRRLAMILALAVLGLAAVAGPVAASPESDGAARILARINSDRVAAGLVAYRVDSRLAALAGNRATWMAVNDRMSHQSFGGAVYDAIAARGVTAYSSGEAVGSTNAGVGVAAADYLYPLWIASPEHHDLIFSSAFNYIGVGLAYRQASNETFASLVFAESPDHSNPVAQLTSGKAVGQTVTFTWSGRDGALQSHTAGLRDFDVQYRVDAGPWRTIRTHTTATKLVLGARPAGHTYSIRVRDRDRRNNLSSWTAARTVRVR
jgi:uncharacterized protein YkwD